jgi:hypothetical protein
MTVTAVFAKVRLGWSFTDVMVTVKVLSTVATPLFDVPPSSVTLTLMSTVPFLFAIEVSVSVAVPPVVAPLAKVTFEVTDALNLSVAVVVPPLKTLTILTVNPWPDSLLGPALIPARVIVVVPKSSFTVRAETAVNSGASFFAVTVTLIVALATRPLESAAVSVNVALPNRSATGLN